MRIYAIRDRLLDYWAQPFAGPDHKAVQQAIARTVNTGDATSDIAQNPHQFEIWQLGIVTEDGHITPEREYICDASSLVRSRVRENDGEAARAGAAGRAPGPQPGPAGNAGGHGSASGRPVQDHAQPEADERTEALAGRRGGYPPPDLHNELDI